MVGVAKCPADRGSATSYYIRMGSSYGGNVAIGPSFNSLSIMDDPSRPNESRMSCKFTDVKSPVRMVILGEQGCFSIAWHGQDAPAEEYRHSKFPNPHWNVAFADGHAQFLKMTFKAPMITRWTADYTFDRDR